MSTVESNSVVETQVGKNGFWVSLVASLCGLGLAAELTRLHVVLTLHPEHQSFCNVNSTVNCDAVAKSTYAVMLGIPVSVWGLFAYSFAFAFSLWGIRSRREEPAAALLLLGLCSTFGAAGLAFISFFKIGSLCLLCLASWAVDLSLFGAAIQMLRRHGVVPALGALLQWLQTNFLNVFVLGLSCLLALAATGKVLSHAVPDKSAVPAHTTTSTLKGTPLPEAKTAQDKDGHHYMGASNPKTSIVEFSDYQCPHCAKSYVELSDMVRRYPEQIRLTHRHFPLDNDCNPAIKKPFHMHSCYYARLAACAGTFGKFWPANEFLFEHGRDEAPVALETLARHVGVEATMLRKCVSEQGNALLKSDLDAGGAMHIEGTPTFIIDGEVHTGELPDSILKMYPLE